MPLKRSTFGKWEVVESDPDIVAQHQETGEKVTITEGGGMKTSSLDTGDAKIGTGDPYQYVSNEHTTVTVDHTGGADYETIQAAVNDAPKRLRHEYIIDIADGHDESVGGDGHVRIQGHSQEGFSTGDRGYGSAGENYQLQLLGNRNDPTQVSLASLTTVGCSGAEMPQIWGMSFNGSQNPDVDESCCIASVGCEETFLGDVTFTANSDSVFHAILAYKSAVNTRRVDWGNDLFEYGYWSKRSSEISGGGSGSVTTAGAKAAGISLVNLNGAPTPAEVENTGRAIQVENDRFIVPSFAGSELGWSNTGASELSVVINNYERVRWQDYQNGTTRFAIEGKGFGSSHIEDLSGQTGDFDGQIRLDNGANTPDRGTACVWDDFNGVWRPTHQPVGSSFS